MGMGNTKELLKLYYPLRGYILEVKKDEDNGTIEILEEDGKNSVALSGTDAEYLERLIERIKGCARIYVSRKFGEPTEIDWKRFEFVFAINGDDLIDDLMDPFYIDEGVGIYFDPCPEPQCIPPFTPYSCEIKGVIARLLRFHKRGQHEKAIGYGWAVSFDVQEIKKCIMGFVEHLNWYYNELKKLEQEDDFEEE